jgi:hypothetical protein
MSLESTTTCFVHWGGIQRKFLNTSDCQLILLITFSVRFMIVLKNHSHGEEQKKNTVRRSQTLLDSNQFVPSFAAPLWTPRATHRRRLCVLTRLFPRIWITSGRPFRPSVSVVVPLVLLAFFFPLQKRCNGSCWLFSFNSSNITRYGPKTCSICRTVLILLSTERSQRCIFITGVTPRIYEPAKSEGWLYSTGLQQTRDKRRLIFGPWLRSPQRITVTVYDDVVIIFRRKRL